MKWSSCILYAANLQKAPSQQSLLRTGLSSDLCRTVKVWHPAFDLSPISKMAGEQLRATFSPRDAQWPRAKRWPCWSAQRFHSVVGFLKRGSRFDSKTSLACPFLRTADTQNTWNQNMSLRKDSTVLHKILTGLTQNSCKSRNKNIKIDIEPFSKIYMHWSLHFQSRVFSPYHVIDNCAVSPARPIFNTALACGRQAVYGRLLSLSKNTVASVTCHLSLRVTAEFF